MQSSGQRIYRMTYERVTESSQRHRRAGPRRDQSTRGFIAARCRGEAGATSESAVYPVIRRTLVRAKGNSIKAKHTHTHKGDNRVQRETGKKTEINGENSLYIKREETRGRGEREAMAKEEQEATGQPGPRGTSSRAMEVVAIRWYATSSKEGEGAVLPRGGILR